MRLSEQALELYKGMLPPLPQRLFFCVEVDEHVYPLIQAR
jgi:hypothetical protein